uniref:Uncharacterized protein n=1 Tax=Homalodisca liturata TaxID=320908 RepID=A0A1B6JP67_9HEMI
MLSRLRVATLKVHDGVRSLHHHGLQVVSEARIFPLVSVIQRPYHWSGDSKLTAGSLASELVRSYASKASSASSKGKPKAAKKESKSSSSSGGKKKKKPCPKKEVEVKKEEKKKTCEKKKYTPKCR